MFKTCHIALLAAMALAACGGRAEVSRSLAYDLDITHPTPNATFLRIAPVAGATRFPGLGQIESPRFSHYLRRRTGCVVNPAYPVAVLGDRRMPAAYVVPITCG